MSLNEFKSFDHYFLHWLRDLEVTPAMAKEMRHEIPFTRPATFDEDKGDFERMQMMTLQSAVGPFIVGFLEIVTGDKERTAVTLEYIKDMLLLLEQKDFMADYLPGLQFMSRLINYHAHIANTPECGLPSTPGAQGQGQDTDQGHQLFVTEKYMDDFNNLKPKSKSILSIAHWMMNESIFGRRGESIENLEEMIQLDPTNWVWHYLMCSRARFLRRSHGDHPSPSSLPGPREIEAATAAIKCSERLNHQLMSTAQLSQCLAEIVRGKAHSSDYGPFLVNEKKYASLDEIVEEIKNAACDALMEMTCAFAEYIRYGEIFGIILPAQYRNYMVAIACMRAAHILCPSNSKVNHKMGSIIINWKKDPKQAAKYLRYAVAADPHNFPAWMDLFAILLRNFEENKEDFAKLFELEKGLDEQWSSVQRGNFAFFEGCVAFLDGKHVDAVKHWLNASSLEYNGFKELQRIRSRYSWPSGHTLTFDAVIQAIDLYQKGHENVENSDAQHLKEIIQNAKAEVRPPMERQRYSSGERNGNGGGGDPDLRRDQPPRPRFRSTNSMSEADNDNCWRRGSTDQATAAPFPNRQFTKSSDNFRNSDRRGGGGGGRGGNFGNQARKGSWNQS